MGGCSVDGRDGEFFKTVAEMIVRFTVEIFPKLAEWERQLAVNPLNLEPFEQEVQSQDTARRGRWPSKLRTQCSFSLTTIGNAKGNWSIPHPGLGPVTADTLVAELSKLGQLIRHEIAA